MLHLLLKNNFLNETEALIPERKILLLIRKMNRKYMEHFRLNFSCGCVAEKNQFAKLNYFGNCR